MLPEAEPDLRFHWSLWKPRVCWSRRFVVECAEGLPAGLMPRLHSYTHCFGATSCRWLNGCVVRVLEGRSEVRGVVARLLRGLAAAFENMLSDFYRLPWHQEVLVDDQWMRLKEIQKAV